MGKKVGIFVFRRDLRLADNTALNAAFEQCGTVLPCFIFTPQQIGKNEYASQNALQFMHNCLRELGGEIEGRGGKLLLLHGQPWEMLPELAREAGAGAVYFNRDYTPYAKMRDGRIRQECEKAGVEVGIYGDALLNEPEFALKKDGAPYTVFTPYYARAKENNVPRPKKKAAGKFGAPHKSGNGDGVMERLSRISNPEIFAKGGRREGLRHLARAATLGNYAKERDLPHLDGTSGLSAHLKFGAVSPREAYWAIRDSLGEGHQLIREIYWRDFFTQVAFHFPRVFGQPFKGQYGKIVWNGKAEKFKAWKEGKTGFPIVDAGMRQLERTGWMHGRVRMIASSFLVKDLHISWLDGERHFASRLVDYDPCVNNGNWQWASSTGCDAQPYFRVFNPFLQQMRFDPDCAYIKKWVGELSSLEPGQIHALGKERPEGLSYPETIVDHAQAVSETKQMFAMAARIS